MVRLLMVAVLFLFNTTCTRSVPNVSLRLSIPAPSGLADLDANDLLEVVIVNIHIPGKPLLVREFNFENQSIPLGQDLNLDINDVPAGSGVFVQVLTVYSNQVNGVFKFLYGDATTTVSSGAPPVEITAANAGASDRMIRLAGRILTSTVPDAGPTGVLIAQFQPPNGKPYMSVDKTPIVNGWFQAFAIDSTTAGFRYVMGDTVVFDNLNSQSPALATSNSRLQVRKPVSARRDNSQTRMDPETDYYLGFWGAGSGKQVCYVDTHEALLNIYTDATLTTPLEYRNTGATTANVRPVAGGSAESNYGVFATAGSTCTNPQLLSGDALIFHNQYANDERDYAGFRVPYQALRPFTLRPSYLIGDYFTGPDRWEIKWKYLPGAAVTGLGTEIWAKYEANGGGGGGKNECSRLTEQGYQLISSVAAPTETYSFTGVPGQPMTAANRYDFRIAACAYYEAPQGRTQLGEYIEANCLGSNCGETEHFGWGVSNKTISGGQFFDSLTPISGKSQRVTGAIASFDNYTSLAVGSEVGFFSGQEALVLVNGAGSATDCGSYQGQTIDVGTFGFARILSTGTGEIRISKGTFLDGITTTNLSAAATTSTFCYVQIVQMIHFRDITITGGPANLTLGAAFDYGAGGGGVIAFRANGTLNLGTSGDKIDVSAKGYPGADSTNANGGGDRRAPIGSGINHMGGQYGLDASGGAGFGGGGSGAITTGGIARTETNQGLRLVFGGGAASSGGSANMGQGGGIVFIAAKEIVSEGGGAIYADGAGSTSYSGAGGGSINLITKKLSKGASTGGVNYLARGGDSSATNSGGGGGGFVSVIACANDLASTNLQTLGGALTGSGVAGSTGSTSAYPSATNYGICR
ncbi:MAG: hypothetical protein AB7F86_00350 [Bdellovibrionales bacterium]